MERSLLRAVVLCTALIWISSPAPAQEIIGLHGRAAPTIEADIRASGFMSPVQAHIFYGDLTGQGSHDAVAFLYHPSGGNSDQITQWLYRDTAAGYSRAPTSPLGNVFGFDPRDVKLSPGRIEITMTVMTPTDPRCCPSGQKTYVLSLDEQSQSGSAPVVGSGSWTAKSTTDPIGVLVEATTVDGRSRISGICKADRAERGFWLTFFHEGDTLRRAHNAPEIFLLEISGRSTQSYSTSTLYHETSGSWIGDQPMSAEFLNAFAAGSELRISREADNRELAVFNLRGTARAVDLMREVCGSAVSAAKVSRVGLPFADGRYLSDSSLCGLSDSQIVDRIGDEIHYVLYVIENGQVNGAESVCDVGKVSRRGNMVLMNARCEVEGMVDNTTLEMTYVSENAFRAGERVFERCP